MYINHSKMAIFIFSLISFLLAMEASMAKVALDSNNREIKVNCSTTMVVEQSGSGSFKSIQAAVDSIPQNNLNWTCILIKEGVYRERVYIPYRKSFIYMAGEGMGITYVVADTQGPMDETATLITQGDNIIFKGISFSVRNPS